MHQNISSVFCLLSAAYGGPVKLSNILRTYADCLHCHRQKGGRTSRDGADRLVGHQDKPFLRTWNSRKIIETDTSVLIQKIANTLITARATGVVTHK